MQPDSLALVATPANLLEHPDGARAVVYQLGRLSFGCRIYHWNCVLIEEAAKELMLVTEATELPAFQLINQMAASGFPVVCIAFPMKDQETHATMEYAKLKGVPVREWFT